MQVRRFTPAISLLACLGAIEAQAQLPSRPQAQNLPEAHARARSERISDISYTLDFRLSKTLAEYTGRVSVSFALSASDSDLTLDFDGGTVSTLEVNGTAARIDYNDFYLTLPAAALRDGENSLTIGFSRPYSSDGSGLYRFIDPEDQWTYLYSDFEPFNQNRLFPAFDQPDLKARFTTTVRVPADWQVIANTRESSIETDGNERVWHFPATAPISTYVYALHAGNYHVWESSADEIPLRLFARESLAPYVYPDNWFIPTRQGLAFYQRYFEAPYAFGKYDQIIVPHFNAGAMENVGAVTFSERYLNRGAVTRQDRRAIASVILHEMAHMWFGDLVTMDWWNGLWLNESFATVMAVIAMTEATEFTDEWQESYRATVRAYQADERDTTHPIELPVPDTDSAFANFDRITYQKGSATLVQLMHLVGPDNFRRGVADYLAAHAFSNTAINDFLDAISRAADMNLDQWARDWLLEAGTNAVEVTYTCKDDRIASMALLQSAPTQWPTLRTHRTQIGLYRFTETGTQVVTVPLTYSGAMTDVQEAAGMACPDFVYANHGDWDYVRVRLDADTVSLLDGMLSRIEDPFARLMLWQSVWDTVLDARMPVTEYVAFALANLEAESNEAVIRQVLATITASASYVDEIVADERTRDALSSRIENVLWDKAMQAEPGSDLQLLFFDTHVRIATSPGAVGRLASMLAGTATPPLGIELDQDRRWSALAAVTRTGDSRAAGLLADEIARDGSDDGRLRALAAGAALPDPANKLRTIESLVSGDGINNHAEFRAQAGGPFPRGQHRQQLSHAPAAIAGLQTINDEHDAEYFGAYTGGLLGPACDANYLSQLEAALETEMDLHPLIRRSLLDSRFETARCLRIRERQIPGRNADTID